MDNEIKKVSTLDKVSAPLLKLGAFMGQQKHFSAIRDAFGAFLPLLIVGAVAVMINSVFVQADGLLGQLVGTDKNATMHENWSIAASYISPLFDGINNATMNLFAVYIAFLLGYFLMGSYGGNQLMGGLIGLASFMLLDVVGAGGMGYLGAKGIIFAFLTGLTAPMLLYRLQTIRAIQINMPEGVPPVVGNSLNSLVPFIITILTFGAIQPIWGAIMSGSADWDAIGSKLTDSGYNLYYLVDALYAFLVSPFMKLSQQWWAVFIILFLIGLFWFFGVHGNNVMGPVVNAVWTPAIVANMALFADVGTIDALYDLGVYSTSNTGGYYVWTEQTMNCFALMGGASSILGLLIGINIFSKLPAQKAVSSIATPIACFNISEPTMFGLPVVLNPAYFVPFIFAGAIQGMVAYGLTAAQIVNPTVYQVPWTAPIFLSGLMATNFDWRSLILTTANLAIAIFIYLPFVLFDIKSQTKAQAVEAGVEYEEYRVTSALQAEQEKAERKANKPLAKIDYKIELLEGDANYIQAKIDNLDAKLESKLYAIEESKGYAEHNSKVYKNLKEDEKAQKELDKIKKADDKTEAIKVKFSSKKDKVQAKLETVNSNIKTLKDQRPTAAKESEENLKVEQEKIKAKHETKNQKKQNKK